MYDHFSLPCFVDRDFRVEAAGIGMPQKKTVECSFGVFYVLTTMTTAISDVLLTMRLEGTIYL